MWLLTCQECVTCQNTTGITFGQALRRQWPTVTPGLSASMLSSTAMEKAPAAVFALCTSLSLSGSDAPSRTHLELPHASSTTDQLSKC